AWKTIAYAAAHASGGDHVRIIQGPCVLSARVDFGAALSGTGPNCVGQPTTSNCTIFRGDPDVVTILPAQDMQDGFRIVAINHLVIENMHFSANGSAVFNDTFKIDTPSSNGNVSDITVRNVEISGRHMSAFQIFGPLSGQSGRTTNLLFENTIAD